MTFVVRYWCVVASHKIVFKMLPVGGNTGGKTGITGATLDR